MITHSTCVDVDALSASELYELMTNPTDSRYQRWWPGVHRQFHVVRRHPATSPVGDVVLMDELVGRRRLRFRGVVRVAEPDRRIVWQLGTGVPGPAWLELTLTGTEHGVRIDHVVRIGFPGVLGRLTDPLVRLYVTDGFADALTQHALTEFPLLAAGAPVPPASQAVPMRRLWERAASSTLQGLAAAELLALMEVEYAAVLRDRPDFVDDSPVLAGHFERVIGPLIAAYKALLVMGVPDPEEYLRRLNDARWSPMAGAVGLVSRLPVPWPVLSRLIRNVMATGFPPVGWEISWVEVSDARVAFDIHGCFYHRVFLHYGLPQLTAQACRGDDVLYARLPGARFVRHGTIGRGDPVCDFRFERGRALRPSVREPRAV